MDATDIRIALRGTADRIRKGEATHLVDGVEGLLDQADQFIEAILKEAQGEMARGNRLDEALQMAKSEVCRLREERDKLEEDKERYGKIIDHLLENM